MSHLPIKRPLNLVSDFTVKTFTDMISALGRAGAASWPRPSTEPMIGPATPPFKTCMTA